MDEADTDGEVVEAAEGVTLRKRFEGAEFHQPAVVYEFSSERDEEVTVRLIEQIPEGLDAADIGFLGSSVDRFWEIKGPKLVFENPLEPNTSFTTACAARGEHADAIRDLVASPDVFEVSPPEAAEAAPTGEFTRSAGTDDGAAEPAPPEPGTDQVVEQFVAELRAGEVDQAHVEYLRDELATARPRRSVETRLKQLQTDVADVRAYTNALEAFLDEHGAADELVDRFEARLASLESAVDDVDEAVDDQAADLADLRDALAETRTDVDSLSIEVEAVLDRIEGLEDDLEAVAETVPDYDVDERFAAVDAELEELSTFTETLKSAFQD